MHFQALGFCLSGLFIICEFPLNTWTPHVWCDDVIPFCTVESCCTRFANDLSYGIVIQAIDKIICFKKTNVEIVLCTEIMDQSSM